MASRSWSTSVALEAKSATSTGKSSVIFFAIGMNPSIFVLLIAVTFMHEL